MTKLTLCDKVLVGDIPTYEIESEEDFNITLNVWFDTKDFEKSVFVCFASFENLDYRDQHNTLMVSHSYIDVMYYLEGCYFMKFKDLNVFEFDSYEEAFKYCIDLKEGL